VAQDQEADQEPEAVAVGLAGIVNSRRNQYPYLRIIRLRLALVVKVGKVIIQTVAREATQFSRQRLLLGVDMEHGVEVAAPVLEETVARAGEARELGLGALETRQALLHPKEITVEGQIILVRTMALGVVAAQGRLALREQAPLGAMAATARHLQSRDRQ
jgi:hypothetical protein